MSDSIHLSEWEWLVLVSFLVLSVNLGEAGWQTGKLTRFERKGLWERGLVINGGMNLNLNLRHY